jgi:hypothetical protein
MLLERRQLFGVSDFSPPIGSQRIRGSSCKVDKLVAESFCIAI